MKGGSTMHKFGLWLSSEADYVQIINEVISKSTSRNINTYTREEKQKQGPEMLNTDHQSLGSVSFRGGKTKQRQPLDKSYKLLFLKCCLWQYGEMGEHHHRTVAPESFQLRYFKYTIRSLPQLQASCRNFISIHHFSSGGCTNDQNLQESQGRNFSALAFASPLVQDWKYRAAVVNAQLKGSETSLFAH